MALFYKKIQRGNPSNLTAPKLWYLVLKSIGLVKEKKVAELLADETTLNPKEAEMTLFQLFKVLIRLLLNGNTVQLGELGTFRLIAHSEGSETEAEANASKIKSVSINFVASDSLREQLKNAEFKDAATLQ
jgi:predicted histone-like DNA-binding protein